MDMSRFKGWLRMVWWILRHPLADKPTYVRRTEERWFGGDEVGVYWEEERGRRVRKEVVQTMKCLKCGSEMIGEHCPGCLADDILRVCGPKAVAAARRFCEKAEVERP